MAGMSRLRGERRNGHHGARALGPALALALALAACSGDEPDGPPPAPEPVALRVDTVSVTGSLDEQTRTEVETDIGDVLSHYVVSAFLGEYPREDFVRSFDDFTVGAASDAAQDIEVLTGAGFRAAESVEATKLDARLAVLAQEGDVVGASAKVRFAFDVDTGKDEPGSVVLTGRFLLERTGGTWSVFGYDVTRDDGAGVPAEVSS
jgi:hypothetical protein